MERMIGLLYEAAYEGSVKTLIELLQQDRLLLDRTIVNGYSETPLHVATMLGHTDFVKEILQRKPQLSKELDSQGSSPLHLASAKGYLEIVKVLLPINSDMCFALDSQGRNPLQLAALKGRLDVLEELVRRAPNSARAMLGHGETILHLCVRHNQLEALIKLILMEFKDEYEFVNARNDYGMTILHLAVVNKDIETVKFLLANTRIEVNTVNANGFTALDILVQSQRDIRDFEISETLRAYGALRTNETPPLERRGQPIGNKGFRFATNYNKGMTKIHPETQFSNGNKKSDQIWLTRKRDTLMVVASLIATMAFDAGLNPPGGVYQNGSDGNNGTRKYEIGKSIIAYENNDKYAQFIYSNTIGFVASLSIILLLVTGLPCQRRLFMWILTVIVWIMTTSMAYTYRIWIEIFTPREQVNLARRVVSYGVIAWAGVMILLLILHTVRVMNNLYRKFNRYMWKERS